LHSNFASNHCLLLACRLLFFLVHLTLTTHTYTLSLHDALPISRPVHPCASTASVRLARSHAARVKHGRMIAPLQQVVQHLVLHRSEEHTSELQSHLNLVCRLLLEKKKIILESSDCIILQ